MSDPEFREPTRPQRHSRRHLTPEQAANRYRYLDTINRRCDAHSRKCVTAANVVIIAYPVEHGTPARESVRLRSCTRHKRQFLYSPDTYQIVSVEDLPPGQPVTRAERENLI